MPPLSHSPLFVERNNCSSSPALPDGLRAGLEELPPYDSAHPSPRCQHQLMRMCLVGYSFLGTFTLHLWMLSLPS